jgi:hypothetical protein
MKNICTIIFLFFISRHVEASTQIEIIKKIPGELLIFNFIMGLFSGLFLNFEKDKEVTILLLISIIIGVITSYYIENHIIGIFCSFEIIIMSVLIRLIINCSKEF